MASTVANPGDGGAGTGFTGAADRTGATVSGAVTGETGSSAGQSASGASAVCPRRRVQSTAAIPSAIRTKAPAAIGHQDGFESLCSVAGTAAAAISPVSVGTGSGVGVAEEAGDGASGASEVGTGAGCVEGEAAVGRADGEAVRRGIGVALVAAGGGGGAAMVGTAVGAAVVGAGVCAFCLGRTTGFCGSVGPWADGVEAPEGRLQVPPFGLLASCACAGRAKAADAIAVTRNRIETVPLMASPHSADGLNRDLMPALRCAGGARVLPPEVQPLRADARDLSCRRLGGMAGA